MSIGFVQKQQTTEKRNCDNWKFEGAENFVEATYKNQANHPFDHFILLPSPKDTDFMKIFQVDNNVGR